MNIRGARPSLVAGAPISEEFILAEVRHLTREALEAGLAEIRQSPREEGVLAMIVRRPGEDEREELASGELSLVEGLVGDDWKARGSRRTADGSAHPDMQITLMNTRLITLLAQEKERWPLAGDQLYVDLDLSEANLPAGTQLAVGTAVVAVTAMPHTGCKKFATRFGVEAVRFVNSGEGKSLRLRGMYARVVQPGLIGIGDKVRKL